MKEEVVVVEHLEVQNKQMGPGQRLRHFRQQKSIPIEDVAGHLNLSVQTVKDLENDDYRNVRFIFVRGYFRSYARLLNLNPDDVVKAFDALELQEQRADNVAVAKPPHAPMRKYRNTSHEGHSLHWVTYLVIIGLIVLVGLWWHAQNDGGLFLLPTHKHNDVATNVTDSVKQNLAVPAANQTETTNPTANNASMTEPQPQALPPEHVDAAPVMVQPSAPTASVNQHRVIVPTQAIPSRPKLNNDFPHVVLPKPTANNAANNAAAEAEITSAPAPDDLAANVPSANVPTNPTQVRTPYGTITRENPPEDSSGN